MCLMATASLAAEMSTDVGGVESIATEAYIYGYPLVTMDIARGVMTNVVFPSSDRAPIGQFAHGRRYVSTDLAKGFAPDEDTLCSTAWLDLSKEPYVLSLPEMGNRYYVMTMLNGWMEVFASVGSRTTGSSPHSFVITGPEWKGVIPSGLKEMRSQTNVALIVSHIYCAKTEDDHDVVNHLQDQCLLQPLSTYGKQFTPEKGMVDSDIDTKTPVSDLVNRMGVFSYFSRLVELLRDNPPSGKDNKILSRLEKIGIVPGRPFNENFPNSQESFKNASMRALKSISGFERRIGRRQHGWHSFVDTGRYGNNYLLRAAMAASHFGAGLPHDILCMSTSVDEGGIRLNGQNVYVLHFDKDALPPVKGFWSLTMCSSNRFLSDRSTGRCSLNSKDALVYNSDGSLDLYIQNDEPEDPRKPNWLFAPRENFALMMRLYWPEYAALNGAWVVPRVRLVGEDRAQ